MWENPNKKSLRTVAKEYCFWWEVSEKNISDSYEKHTKEEIKDVLKLFWDNNVDNKSYQELKESYAKINGESYDIDKWRREAIMMYSWSWKLNSQENFRDKFNDLLNTLSWIWEKYKNQVLEEMKWIENPKQYLWIIQEYINNLKKIPKSSLV